MGGPWPVLRGANIPGSSLRDPERGPAGTRVSRPAPPPPRLVEERRRGCNLFQLPHLPLLSAPPICFPSLQSCHLHREEGGALRRWAGTLLQGTLGFQRLWKGWPFMERSRPSPICLYNCFPSSHRWLPPPSPEMSGRRLPVSYTGAPYSLGAPIPRVRRWRCC